MLTLRRVAFAALFALTAAGVEAPVSLIVTGDRVCLRAKADGESEVVCQVSTGERLQRTGEGSNWVEVIAPAEAPVWVSASFVSNGVVRVSKANVRAGPGLNYTPIGSVSRGDKVDVRATEYGWARIRPPPDCRLWISSDYVRPAPVEQKAAASLGGKPIVGEDVSAPPSGVVAPPVLHPVEAPHPPAAVPQAVVKADVAVSEVPKGSVASGAGAVATQSGHGVTTESVAAVTAEEKKPIELPTGLTRYEMEEDAVQGRQAIYRGTMDKCTWLLRKPAPYRLLVKHARRGIVTLCYVSGDSAFLAPMDGKKVVVSGREYRLKGIDRPVVAYETVVEDSGILTGEESRSIIP